MIAYLAMEWIATPVVAGFAGLQSRYSHRQALLLGVPLVLLFTVATPTASSGGAGLYVIVPWLSLYQAKKVQMLPVLTQRLEWWAVIYALGYALGVVSRRLRPHGVPGDS